MNKLNSNMILKLSLKNKSFNQKEDKLRTSSRKRQREVNL